MMCLVTWTQSLCEADWFANHPEREPVRVRLLEQDPDDVCCLCGTAHRSGIYVRQDPKLVPYPRVESE